MPAKMDLVITAVTKHVLAAALRGDTTGPAPDVASLVGAGLVIRDPVTGNTRLTVGPEQLAVQSVDVRDDVLLTANQFLLADNLPELGTKAAAPPLDLTGTEIKVHVLDAAPDQGTNVWVYIEGGPQPIVQQVLIAKGLKDGSEPLLLAAATYRALVLAPGVEAKYIEITVA